MTLIRAIRYSALLSLLLCSAAQSQTADRGCIVVLIGPTGSGKSTQAEFVKKRFGIPIILTFLKTEQWLIPMESIIGK